MSRKHMTSEVTIIILQILNRKMKIRYLVINYSSYMLLFSYRKHLVAQYLQKKWI